MKTKIIYNKEHCKNENLNNFSFFNFEKKLRNNDLLIFIQSICEFLKISKDIVFCIESSVHCLNSQKKLVFLEIIENINQGKTLSKSLSDFNVFPNWAVKLIKSGERNNDLLKSFDMIKDFLSWNIEQQKKLKNALTYPIFTFFAFVGIVFLFSNYIAPSIFELLSNFDESTLGSYNIFCNVLFVLKSIIFIVFSFILFLLFLYKFEKNVFEKILFSIPIFGKLFMYKAIYMNSYYMFNSQEQGSDIIESLEVAIDSNDGLIKDLIIHIKKDVTKGLKINESLKKLDLPEILVNIVKIGEDSGNLKNGFYLAKETFFNKYQMIIDKIVNFLPIILLFFTAAMMISFILLIFMPIYSLNI